MPPTLPFTLLDRYNVEAEIGRGANAIVYRAHDRVLGRDVAIKIIRDDVLNAGSVARFQREIHFTARLEHRHILHVYDTGTFEGRPFVVMEFASGRSLADRLAAEGQLPVPEALRIATDVGQALHHAHLSGIVHRDVKPDNILLSEGGAFLGDFGIARAASSEITERLTSTGVAVGTVLYMSPEQLIADRDVDGRSDQYSLACVLYEMLAGVRPHVAASMEALRVMRSLRNHVPVLTHRPSVSAAVNDAIECALAPIPADRFPTMQSFIDALHDESRTASPRTGQQRAAPPSVGKPATRVFAAAGIVAVVAVAAVKLLNPATPLVTPDGDTLVAISSAASNGEGPSRNAEFVQALQDEVSGWSQVRLVSDVASGTNSVSVQAAVTRAGDSLRVRVDVARGAVRRPIVLMVGASEVGAGQPLFARLAREILSGSDSVLTPGLHGLSVRSLRALQDYVRGHASLRAGQLDSAGTQFRRAGNAEDDFAHASLWAAEAGALLAPRAVEQWKRYAEAAARSPRLRGVDSSLAAALLAQSRGAYPDACNAFRDVAARGSATVRFLGWYGLGECAWLDSTVVPAGRGWQFRASHWSALQAYEQAVRRAPTSALVSALFTRVMSRTYAEDSRIRLGASEGPRMAYFAAYPSLDADTLAFLPLPRDAINRMDTGTIPASLENARARGRAAAIDITESWVALDRTSAPAWLAHAVALEQAGKSGVGLSSRSAANAIEQAEQHASASAPVLKVRVLIARARIALRSGDVEGAVASSVKALSLRDQLAPADQRLLAPLAVFVGQTDVATQVGYSDDYAPRIQADLAREVFRFHVRALVNDCEGLQQARDQVLGNFDNRVPAANKPQLRDSILKPMLRAAIPCLGPDVLKDFAPQLPIDRAYAALRRGDTTGARRILRAQREGRSGVDLASMTRDYIWAETWAWFQVGDSVTARAQLINPLEYLSSLSVSTLDQIPQAAGLRNALLLTARLANAGDTTAAIRKWGKRAAVLSNVH